jgi:hypothetical protein
LQAVRAADGIDAILLDLHGALVAENAADGEGTLLEKIRQLAPDTPLAVALDLHGNVTEKMVHNADILVSFKTYPHVDMAETGEHAGRLMMDLLSGQSRPITRWKQLPLLSHTLRSNTNEGAMQRAVETARQAELEQGVLAVSIMAGFSLADFADAGMSVIVVTDNDEQLAESVAHNIAQQIWQERDGFVYHSAPLKESLERARELQKSEGIFVEQVIRPTGLLDPPIEVRPVGNQVDDLLEEIHKVVAKDERVLVTTLTKRMAEELTKYLTKLNVRCRYIHSEVDTLDRVEILRQLRVGLFDVLIGINLLREGLDLPEVSFVAILDADKEGFLRNERSLVQTVGRASRNVNGRVIMYADKITDSIRFTMEETQRRRKKQIEYNFNNNITPVQAGRKQIAQSEFGGIEVNVNGKLVKTYVESEDIMFAADPVLQYMNSDELKKQIAKAKSAMIKASKELNFMEAARLRDEMYVLEKLLNEKN